jgi:hypothetical protein
MADLLLFVIYKICQCNDNQSLAANSWNVVYMLVEIPKIHTNWFILGKTINCKLYLITTARLLCQYDNSYLVEYTPNTDRSL